MSNNPVDDKVRESIEQHGPDLVDPLDYLLLESLTPEGTTQSGLYPLGVVTVELSKQFQLDSNLISGRLRYMLLAGLTTKVRALGGKNKTAWQRTARGDEVLNAWKETQNG